jgi:hypothetical protein
MEEIRNQFLKIYNEPAPKGMDLYDYAQKIRNLAMEGVNMIRPVEMTAFKEIDPKFRQI